MKVDPGRLMLHDASILSPFYKPLFLTIMDFNNRVVAKNHNGGVDGGGYSCYDF